MKQHLRIKKFYGQSEWAIQNQMYLALIVFCLHVLAQAESNSQLKILKVSRSLRATLWKPAYFWLRRIEAKSVP